MRPNRTDYGQNTKRTWAIVLDVITTLLLGIVKQVIMLLSLIFKYTIQVTSGTSLNFDYFIVLEKNLTFSNI